MKNPELVNGYLVSVSILLVSHEYYIIKYETGLSECKFSGKIDSLWATKYSLNACESKNINKIP